MEKKKFKKYCERCAKLFRPYSNSGKLCDKCRRKNQHDIKDEKVTTKTIKQIKGRDRTNIQTKEKIKAFKFKINEKIDKHSFLESIFNYYHQVNQDGAIFFLSLWAFGKRMKFDELLYYLNELKYKKFKYNDNIMTKGGKKK